MAKRWSGGACCLSARALRAGSVILGATKLAQLDDTTAALDFELPAELAARLDAVSAPREAFPYTLFTLEFQRSLHGGAQVGDKPAGYQARVVVPGRARKQ